jgi:long-chain fatty acid transport protein
MTVSRLFTWCLLAAFALAWVSELRADGLIRDGVGAISTGRGGTNFGFADNGAILLDNPGAMTNVRGNGLCDLDVDTVIAQVDYTDIKGNAVSSHVRPVPVPDVALIRKTKDGRFAYGIGLFGPAGFGAAYDFQNSFAGPQVYKSFGAMGKLLPGIAYRVTDRLSIGGTVGIAESYVGINGPLYMQSGALRGAPAIVALEGVNVAPTGAFGIQYKLNEKTTLGMSYLSESRFHLKGVMNAEVYGLAPMPLYSRLLTSIDMTWPRQWGAGFSHRFNNRNIFAADVIWFDWSHAFNHVGINLTNASNPMVPLLLGPASFQNLPMNWRDTVSLRLGYQWMPDDVSTYRFGYVYHSSPVPSNTLTPYTDGILLHAFSLGYSRRVGRAYVNFAYQYTFGPTRHVATSALAGGDFSNSTLHAQAHIAMMGILIPF